VEKSGKQLIKIPVLKPIEYGEGRSLEVKETLE